MKRMQRVFAKQCKPCVNYLWDELDTDKISSITGPPQADSGALWEVSLSKWLSNMLSMKGNAECKVMDISGCSGMTHYCLKKQMPVTNITYSL